MDKEHEGIERLKLAARLSQTYYKKPLLVCDSGGKDSLVCVELALRAGIDFEVLHSHTTADAPDTVYYVRQRAKEILEKGIQYSISYPTYKGKRTSLWDLIPQKSMPPSRKVRYCCAVLKETGGANRAVVTGVRKGESAKRRKREFVETITSDKNKKVKLNYEDASEAFSDSGNRKAIEHDEEFRNHCKIRGKTIFNPIIDWTDEDVWDFIKSENLNINLCYEKYHMKRVGCVGCPMGGRNRWKEFTLFPKYRDMYLMAFKNLLQKLKNAGKGKIWQSEWDIFWWWMEEEGSKKDKKEIYDGQMSLFDLKGGEK